MFGGAFIISYLLPSDLLSMVAILYSSSYMYVEDVTGSGYSLLLLLGLITISSFYLIKEKLNNVYSVLIHALVFSVCIQSFAPHFAIGTRVATFFWIYIIILIPNLIHNLKYANNRRLAVLTVCILAFCYFQYFIMTPSTTANGLKTNSQATIPYNFIWE